MCSLERGTTPGTWPPPLAAPAPTPGTAPVYPEDVVDEEAPEQDAACADVVQVQQLHPVEGERQPKEVVGNPVLGTTGKGDLGPTACADLHGKGPGLIQPGPWLQLTYLSQQVPDPHNTAQGQAHEILGVKLVIHYFCNRTEKVDVGQLPSELQ